jgi:DNA-binding MarR family transcriptional regulator
MPVIDAINTADWSDPDATSKPRRMENTMKTSKDDNGIATLNPQLLGQAEAAHRALLDRILAGTGNTYPQWVALSISAAAGEAIDRRTLADRIAGALKLDDTAVQEAIAALSAAGLLEEPGNPSQVQLTDAGKELHRHVRGEIDEVIAPLYSDIPAEDLATAGRVLSEITQRANAELAGK